MFSFKNKISFDIENNRKIYTYIFSILIFSFLSFAFIVYQINFNKKTLDKDVEIKIYSGFSTYVVSENLKSLGVIDSDLVFRLLSYFYNTENKLKTGVYIFKKDKEYSVYDVYKKVFEDKYDKPLLVLVVPEGWSNIKIANRLEALLPDFNKQKFIEISKNYEGYLFPETYFIDENMSEEKLLNIMLEEFKTKNNNYTKEEIILASILEGEAKLFRDMSIISGILQTRLQIGMRLQVDVSPETYNKKGLPEKPINNPGINAFNAVRNPIYTDYLYYITGNNGNMYYAKTYTEHKKNINKYLK